MPVTAAATRCPQTPTVCLNENLESSVGRCSPLSEALCSMLQLALTCVGAVYMQVAMMDPVIAGDGHTYERTAIQHCLQASSISPVTRVKLPHTRVVPNMLVKSALAQHAQVS